MRLFHIFSKVFKKDWSLYNTIRLNFWVFPFKTAIKLPIKFGHRIDSRGLKRGSISFPQNVTIGKFIAEIGTCPHPMFSPKGLHTLLRFHPKGKLIINAGTKMYAGCSLTVGGTLQLGRDVLINQHVLIDCMNSITINECTSIGWYSQLYDWDFHYLYFKSDSTVHNCISRIEIGRNVWITNHVTITKGCIVPDYSVIGSNSLVNKDFSSIEGEDNFFAGIPAKYIGKTGRRIVNNRVQYRLSREFAIEKAAKLKVEPEEFWFNHRWT